MGFERLAFLSQVSTTFLTITTIMAVMTTTMAVMIITMTMTVMTLMTRRTITMTICRSVVISAVWSRQTAEHLSI